jgi:hypothetical protein
MSPDDVSPNEMKHFENISDADFEALRAGLIPGDDERLGEIARFADDLNKAFPASSTDALEGAHLSAMLATSRVMAANGEPAEESQSGIVPRRQPVFKTFLHSRMAKISAAAVAAMLAFAGVAAAGVLPSPLQNAVANVVAPTGIDLPGGTVEVKAVEPAETPEAAHTDASVDESATIENDQGENNDNQGEDASDASDEASASAEHAAEAAQEAAQEAADQAAEAAKEAAEHAAEKASENSPEDAASTPSGD